MKMAKATKNDINAAMLLLGMMNDVFEIDQYPRGLDGEFSEDDPDYFDEDNDDHLRAFYRRLREVFRQQPGGMNRVIFGMEVLLNPKNRIVDPDQDVLAFHPLITWKDEPKPEPEGNSKIQNPKSKE